MIQSAAGPDNDEDSGAGAQAASDKRASASTGSLRRDNTHDSVITRIKNVQVGVVASSRGTLP